MKSIGAVHKFGGSCLTDSHSFHHAAKLVIKETSAMVVLSATQETTNQLLHCLNQAKQDKNYVDSLKELQHKHQSLLKDLADTETLEKRLIQDFDNIHALLQSVQLLKSYSKIQHDWLLGHGEYWASLIFARVLSNYQPCDWLDAGEILTVFDNDDIDWQTSKQHLLEKIQPLNSSYIVLPGFVASNAQKQRILLGFNGSDYSAAILAKLLDCQSMTKWTNVTGVYSADPKKVISAFAIKHLNYQEAAELAYFGANILHPNAVQPVYQKNIPIKIKNIHHPELPGSLISNDTDTNIVCGLTSIEEVALVNIEGNGLLGVCGIAARVFDCLRFANISVILISQASSEHSISFVVTNEQSTHAQQVLAKEFAHEIQLQSIDRISCKKDCAIIAAVGEGMVGKPGVASRFFSSLANANINIQAIAQGSSERNISIVVNNKDCARSLRALHGGFYLAKRTLSVGIIGPGGVGKTFIKQLNQNLSAVCEKHNVNIKIRGLMDSKHMLLDENSIDLTNTKSLLKEATLAACPKTFAQHIGSIDFPHAIIVDCTASQQIADSTLDFLNSGCHVITPNKKANSGSLAYYRALKEACHKNHRHYLFETTVCAGLPVIKTLHDLLATGDEIIKIEGIVSGTLSYIFNQVASGLSFAQSVLLAYEQGYTEPDPRDDLSGLDVARKFICLGRELGMAVSLDDVELLNLIPEPLTDVSIEEFLKKLPDYDKQLTSNMQSQIKPGEKLCYVGEIENNIIKVSLKAYQDTHPFFHTQGTDNILSFTTNRYSNQPLIIQGPGAGLEVTAAGIFADLINLTAMI